MYHYCIMMLNQSASIKKVGRPRKPDSRFKSKSANWRLVIPNLQEYKDANREQLLQLKYQTLELLLQRQQKYDLRYYHIALQHHVNNIPHLDILVIYDKSVQHKFTHFDYLIKHGKITTYRRLNAAILDYGKKEDQEALSNLPEDSSKLIKVDQLKSNNYAYLESEMLKDPLNFNLEQYVYQNNLAKYISSWSSIKTKLKDMQQAAAHLRLQEKPGFKFISRSLIEESLDSKELKLFDSWKGYQTIVDYLNHIPTWSYKRPLKTKNLLITGEPNIGKTSFIESDLNKSFNCIEKYCSLYPMSSKTWWPNYKSEVYQVISWNETKLTAYSYDVILKVLEGAKVDLPQKGSSTLKYDNPLVLMTSNMTLEQMIKVKFGYSPDLIGLARKNLGARIENVIIPKGLNLFLLQKLLLPI